MDHQGFVFDPFSHTYYLNDRRLPSVTQILTKAGHIHSQFYQGNEAMERGTLVHKFTELMDEWEIPADGSLEEIRPYAQAWQDFKDAFGARVVAIERRIYHPVYQYAGTIDRVLEKDGKFYILDIKTGSSAAWHPLQGMAYKLAWEQWEVMGNRKIDGILVCYLTSTARFSLKTWDSEQFPSLELGWLRALESLKEEAQ